MSQRRSLTANSSKIPALESAPVLDQICLVIWKHYKSRKRSYIWTFLEITIPIAIFLFVSYARSTYPSITKEYVPITLQDSTSIDDLITTIDTGETRLLYTPDTYFTKNITREVQLKLSIDNEAIGFNNKENLMTHYKENGDTGITVIVSFDGINEDLPSKLNYDLQIYDQAVLDWQTDRLYRNDIDYIPGAGSLAYLGHQFIAFQWALDTSFIELITNSAYSCVSMRFTEFPYPPHWKDDGMNTTFVTILPVLIMISFGFLFPFILMIIVRERTSNVKLLLIINGLRSWVYWIGWYLNAFSLCCISGVTIAVLLTCKIFHKEYAPLQHVNFVQLVILILLFCSATIAFIFSISNIFKSAAMSMVGGIAIWFISYVAYVMFANYIKILPLFIKVIATFMPHIALFYGCEIIATGEIRGGSTSFTEVIRTSTSEDMKMFIVVVMLIIDTLLYLLITVLFETDVRGKYRISRLYNNITRPANTTTTNGEDIPLDNESYLVEIKELKKIYDTVTAVDNLSLNVRKGDIMVLLGHCESGKTTILSILSGMEKQTAGEININTEKISICTRKTMLFATLSVKEHLVYFAKLRGINSSDIKKVVNDLLNSKLKLYNKRHELPKNLNDGEKRKLAVAIAFVGHPTLVILDEPTTGMDSDIRGEIWNMIKECRNKNNTFIIGTHSLEEAEVLGNRIAIISNGELVCHGTPMELDKNNDVGYHIQLNYIDTVRLPEIQNLINEEQKHTYFKVNEVNPTSGKLYVPSVQNNHVYRLLEQLNRLKGNKLEGYKISYKSLGNILRTLMNKNVEVKSQNNEPNNQNNDNLYNTERSVLLGGTLNDSSESDFWTKILIILKQKYIFLNKTRTRWAMTILLFYLLTAVTFAMTKYYDVIKDDQPIVLNLGTYGNTTVPYHIYENDRLENIFTEYVIQSSSTPCATENITTLLLNEAEKNIIEYKTKFIAGMEMHLAEHINEVNILYSNQAIHGAPISLNLATNTILRYFTGNTNHTITTAHSPLRPAKIVKYQRNAETYHILVWNILPVACLFSVIMFTFLPTLERKHLTIILSRIYNFPLYLYWPINYIIDMFTYIIIILCPVLVLTILSSLDIIILTNESVGYFIITLVWYGVVMIPYCYFISLWGKSTKNAFALILIPNIALSPVITGMILSSQIGDSTSGNTLLGIFAWVNPHVILTYTMSMICIKMVKNHNWDILSTEQQKDICKYETSIPCCDLERPECQNQRSYIQHGEYLVCSFVASLLLMVVIILMDNSHRLFSDYLKKSIETVKVKNLRIGFINFKMLKCELEYKEVIKDISFKINKGEVFGLLGGNGTGKTTLLKILTRQEKHNRLLGNKFKGSIEISPKIGYCPQNYIMMKCFTGKELLQYFGKLRNPSISNRDIEDLITKCELNECSNIPYGNYSHGNKKKLHTCIALIGNPDVVVLDEPMADVDPKNRNIIRELIRESKKNSAIIFTSQSIYECEKICDKLAIMKDGKVDEHDIRSVLEFNEEYEQGHIVHIKIEDKEKHDDFVNDIKGKFEDVKEIKRINALSMLRIPNSDWLTIFKTLETLKKDYSEMEYIVKQSSLTSSLQSPFK